MPGYSIIDKQEEGDGFRYTVNLKADDGRTLVRTFVITGDEHTTFSDAAWNFNDSISNIKPGEHVEASPKT